MVSSIGSSSDMQQLMALMMQKISAADTDGTAGLSKSELSSVNAGDDVGGANFLSALSKNFDKIDTNGDGQLSSSEISSAKPPSGPMGPPPGLQIESDGDSDDSSSVSSTASTSGTDSTSSAAETLLEKLLAALQESLAKSMGESSSDSSSSNSSDKSAVSSVGKLDFSSADVDGVSGLSKTELASVDTSADPGAKGFLNELSKNFDSVDANSDGQLSTDEIAAVSKGQHSQSTSASSNADTLKNLTGSFIQQLLNGYQDKLGDAASALNIAV